MNFKPILLETAVSGNINNFYKEIRSKTKIYFICGARDSGKSVLGFRILENLAYLKGKKSFALGFPSELLPDWIIRIEDLSELLNNSVLIIDEGALRFNAKKHFTFDNENLLQLMTLCRHKAIDLIIISQNSANIDLNVIRQSDIILLKEPAFMQISLERPAIAKLYKEAKKHFKDRIANRFVFVVCEQLKGLCRNTLPSFWNEGLSVAFANVKFEKEMEAEK